MSPGPGGAGGAGGVAPRGTHPEHEPEHGVLDAEGGLRDALELPLLAGRAAVRAGVLHTQTPAASLRAALARTDHKALRHHQY